MKNIIAAHQDQMRVENGLDVFRKLSSPLDATLRMNEIFNSWKPEDKMELFYPYEASVIGVYYRYSTIKENIKILNKVKKENKNRRKQINKNVI